MQTLPISHWSSTTKAGAPCASAPAEASAAASAAMPLIASAEQEVADDRDLVRVDQRGRVADAGDLDQLRARAALGHRARGLAREQVGGLAAQQERRAADRVVELPQLDVLVRVLGVERHRERGIVVQ